MALALRIFYDFYFPLSLGLLRPLVPGTSSSSTSDTKSSSASFTFLTLGLTFGATLTGTSSSSSSSGSGPFLPGFLFFFHAFIALLEAALAPSFALVGVFLGG